MSDLASLYIKVDSTGVVTASRSLDELAGKSQKVEEATRKVTKATDSAASSMGKYITAAAATAAVMKLIQQSVQAFMEAEKATLRMAMAMKNQGDFSRAALNDLKDYASQLQKVTAYEDDATLSLMANLKSYGMTNEEVKKATKVAMDFASAKQAEGMSVKTAAELLGKAYAGNTQTLARYGIVVGEIKDKSEKYNAVMKQLEQRFGGSAQAELLTYAGQWQKLKNQWGDIQEFLGIIFLKTLQAVQVAAGLVGVAFMSMGSKILQVLDILMTPLKGLLMLTGLIAGALGADGLASAMNLAASAISDARARILDAKDSTMAWTSANYDQLKSFDGIETAVEKMGNTGTRTTYNLKEGTDKATKAAQKLREEWIKLKAELEFEKATAGMDDLDKALAEIERDIEKMRSNPNADLKLIDEVELQRQTAAIKEWYDEYLQEQIKAKENFDRYEKAKQDSIAKGAQETAEEIKKQYADKQAKFQDEYKRATMSTTEYELDQLQSRYDEYATYISDKEKLDEWYEASKEKLLDKEAKKEKDQLDDLKRTIEGWGRDSADAIVKFARTGEMSFSDMIDSMIDDLLRMMIYQNITSPLFGAISSGLGSLFGGAASIPATTGPAVWVAKGNVFQSGNVIPFARGGIVDRPTVFPMARGAGLMGEAGPEAVMPLTRIGGDLGVRALAGGGTEVNIYNNVGADVSTKERTTADGSKAIDVYIDQAVAKKLGQFGSQSNRAMRQMGGRQPLTGR